MPDRACLWRKPWSVYIRGSLFFIQNPFRPELGKFCVEGVFLNDRKLDLNYRLSALKIDFKETDLFTPVSIRIEYSDSLCSPEFVNTQAIFFHSSYKFLSVNLSDSALYWTTEGERETGIYTVEKLENGIWIDQEVVPAEAKFEFTEYTRTIQSLKKGPISIELNTILVTDGIFILRRWNMSIIPIPSPSNRLPLTIN